MDDDLNQLGLVDDEDIILDEAALTLALLDHPGADEQPYLDLLEAVANRLETVGAEADTARDRAYALASVLAGEFGFVGDAETYDDPANADLIQVIDRRRGLPVSLSILYVAAARRVGWTASVLDVPGHVLVLVSEEVAPVIVDPFRGGVVGSPDQLVVLLRGTTGDPPRRGQSSGCDAEPGGAGPAAHQPGDPRREGGQGQARAGPVPAHDRDGPRLWPCLVGVRAAPAGRR